MHLLGLAPGGVYMAADIPADAGALLPHPFTLTPHCDAICSLLHFPSGSPAWLLASTVLFGVRTFLDALAPRFLGQPGYPL